jgi:formylglycine-generating enzyme required for sulfatase activity
MKCQACGFISPDGMSFCGCCGASLTSPPKAKDDLGETGLLDISCPECSATMPPAAAFCGKCGHHLKRAEQAPEPPPESDAESKPASNPKPVPVEQVWTSVAVPGQSVPPPIKDEPKETPEEKPESEVVTPKDDESLVTGIDISDSPRMRLIPAGTFQMGAIGPMGNEDERPRHIVRLSAFEIDVVAVSNAEYEKFDPSHIRQRPVTGSKDDDPVVYVTYEDCLRYCRWRDEQEQLPPGTYSLPTEAQWECAARGGQVGLTFPWGDELDPTLCNTRESEKGETVCVNDGVPNGYGLFHMCSNVREWCLDWYDEYYYQSRAAAGPNPSGPRPGRVINFRVIRGACFRDPGLELARCSARTFGHSSSSSDDTGFRCVRRVKSDV